VYSFTNQPEVENSTMKKQSARFNHILTILKNRQMATITEISRECGVSDVTTRRDLRKLQDEGLVTVVSGAASLNLTTEHLAIGDKYYLAQQAQKQLEEKRRIAAKAATFLVPNETVFIDMGSTPYFLARAIPSNMPLTVICYSLNTFIELHERHQFMIVFAGGIFDSDSLICKSDEGISMISRMRAHKLFMTCSGFCTRMGVTTATFNEQDMKRIAISSSLKRYLLMDSTKCGVVKAAHMADITEFDAVITDTGIPEEYERHIRDAGLELYKV
jgi:DeoR family transcriptional regulator, deoxyribose operon repressor